MFVVLLAVLIIKVDAKTDIGNTENTGKSFGIQTASRTLILPTLDKSAVGVCDLCLENEFMDGEELFGRSCACGVESFAFMVVILFLLAMLFVMDFQANSFWGWLAN